MTDYSFIRVRRNTDKNIEKLQKQAIKRENRNVTKGEIVDIAINKELETNE